ncbi:hypothetical protein [Rubripirellula reticaptiva]|uniref:Uncharacterized protein n=1 Tax=Rubripirellula reticaptiva TaxID=2528013 RepID=A0A5C6EXL8_9BACT|nr:hypothetical protein [Rubripirellula reticaptiva]TWU51961.1 hypothetical protein Poly59_35580 [Rubripirellula reticaptiva]
MATEPTVDVLLDRFSQEAMSVFYPFLIVSVVDRNGSASREQIAGEISKLTRGAFSCEPASHNRQVSRLEKTFRLIEPVNNEKNRTLVQYRLTAKGKRLYAESLEQVVHPLRNVLKSLD